MRTLREETGRSKGSKLKQCELVELLMPLQWFLKHLDPDCTKPFGEVKEDVARRAQQYYDLIAREGEKEALCARAPKQASCSIDDFNKLA